MLTFDEYGDGIGNAWTVIREHANRSGPDAEVVTCPGWRMRDLVAHQGTVHRWATAAVRGQRVDTESLEADGLAAADQLVWFDGGTKELLQALDDASDDLEVPFFLHDAPPAKLAWARRQCHETTIHAVDAMSASLGRAPYAAEAWFGTRHAVDGIDELLTGFVPRKHERLRSESPRTVLVETTDADAAWTMTISPDPVVTERGRSETPDTVLSGTAVQLYLGLWNRGREITGTGLDLLDEWRTTLRISWR